MRSLALLCLMPVAAVAAWAGDVTQLPDDQPVEVNGIKLACTGIGDDAQHDPRWKAYSSRIEFANAAREYLSDVVLAVSDANGKQLFKVRCGSPWVLAALAPAKYQLTATFESLTTSDKFTAPKKGQKRFIVRFAK